MQISKTKLILGILAVIFFVVYAGFSFLVILPNSEQNDNHKIFSWPDAMANNFFISNFVNENSFSQAEPLNLDLQNVIHPRSVNIVADSIVPMSFLGMPIIYGYIAKVVGLNYIMLLTPLLAVLAGLMFFKIILYIFNDKKIALMSAFLLLILPAYWYYANLAMLQTSLFIFLVMSGIYFFIKSIESSRSTNNYVLLSGIDFGLAIITRTIEIYWLILILLVILYLIFKKNNLLSAIFFIFGLSLSIGVMLIYNQIIYGDYLTFGYLQMNTADNLLARLPSEFNLNSSNKFINYFKAVIVPFGFHPRLIWFNFKHYILLYLWPLLILLIIGKVLIFAQLKKLNLENPKRVKLYFVLAGLITAWLLFFYGSWQFNDPLVLQYNLIGSSYSRYFLPIQILMLPIVAYALNYVLELNWPKLLKNSLVGLILVLLTIFSINKVYFAPYDGLIKQKEVIETYYQQFNIVSQLVEANAIIISNREDKIFFPKYNVIMFNNDYTIFDRIKSKVNELPFYYYTMMNQAEIEEINKKLLDYNLVFENEQIIDTQFKLYKLNELN